LNSSCRYSANRFPQFKPGAQSAHLCRVYPCRFPDEWLLGSRHPILVDREVLKGLLADLKNVSGQ
jgi:hypothetical protein